MLKERKYSNLPNALCRVNTRILLITPLPESSLNFFIIAHLFLKE